MHRLLLVLLVASAGCALDREDPARATPPSSEQSGAADGGAEEAAPSAGALAGRSPGDPAGHPADDRAAQAGVPPAGDAGAAPGLPLLEPAAAQPAATRPGSGSDPAAVAPPSPSPATPVEPAPGTADAASAAPPAAAPASPAPPSPAPPSFAPPSFAPPSPAPPSPAPPIPWIQDRPLPAEGPLRVAQDGSGHFRSVAHAALAAPHGREIRIAPGLYREAVTLDHKLLLVADGGEVTLDGGPAPAVSLDAVTAVTLRGLTLLSGVAAASVGQGQLVLEECVLRARALGVALRATDPRSQLVVRRCRVEAGAGAALQLQHSSRGELRDSVFTWDEGNPSPLLVPGSVAAFTVQGCSFGWRRQTPLALLAEVLSAPLPVDGRSPLVVQPDVALWPAWARANATHATTISAAVAAAPAGLRVDIAPGSYEESVGLRQSVHLRPLAEPGSVVVRFAGAPCLWFNGAAGSLASATGLRLLGDVPERTATVQHNGGVLQLGDCTLVNATGHALIATSQFAAGRVELSACTVEAAGRGLFVTGAESVVVMTGGSLTSQSLAVLVLEGGRVELRDTQVAATLVGVEVWGPEARVDMARCAFGPVPRLLQLARGATRSQVTTAGMAFDPAPVPAPAPPAALPPASPAGG